MKVNVCVIGAGASGLGVCKKLKEHDIDFICFEKSSKIGGMWRYNNDNNLSAAYKSLCMNTSKRIASYPSYPMKDTMTEFPNHEDVIGYFEEYANHFGLMEHIRFSSDVAEIAKRKDESFVVKLADGYENIFTHVIVAQGRFWNPTIPKFNGEFSGKELHSFEYSVPTIFDDKNVLVVGFGASGVDITIDASRFAKKVYVSTRDVPFIFPKFIFGKPSDAYALGPFKKLPGILQGTLAGVASYLTQGKQTSYGFPKPNLKANKFVTSSELLSRFSTGKIEILSEIEELRGEKVKFKKGEEKDIDVIVYATGYEDIFPFFKNGTISRPHSQLSNELYKRTIHVEHNNLFFVGYIRPPEGSLIPITETQGEWIARVLKGEVEIPAKEVMKEDIKKEIDHKKKIFKKDFNKHIDVVDYLKFPKILVKEMKKYKMN